MVDTKNRQEITITEENHMDQKATETKKRRNSITEKVKHLFQNSRLRGSSELKPEGEQVETVTVKGDAKKETVENEVESAKQIHNACMNEENTTPVTVTKFLKTVLEYPKQKRPSNVHKHFSQWLRHFTSTMIKHLVYLDYLHKNHYVTVKDLHKHLQDLYGKKSEFPSTPDLTISNISPQNTPVLIIDARRPDEYAISHIPGSVNIHSLLSRRVSRHLQNVDPNTPIVTYCAAGLRSGWMATRLRHLGFKNVRTLEGFYQWASEGKPMIGEDGTLVQKVLPQHFLASLLLDKEIMYVQTKTTTIDPDAETQRKTTETKVVFNDKH